MYILEMTNGLLHFEIYCFQNYTINLRNFLEVDSRIDIIIYDNVFEMFLSIINHIFYPEIKQNPKFDNMRVIKDVLEYQITLF